MLRNYFILLILILLTRQSIGQTVGLVLSGGGSKGLTHIGVIKALEENRIPIDYIGGTSMGAIVGGCYAMGFSPDEMITIFRSEEFKYWLRGELEEQYKYYFKAENPAPDLFNVGLDLRDTIASTRLPLSIIPNYLMDFIFMEIFSRASAASGYNFDSLFVPFLCNSVDISNSKEVVFREGDLAQAIRASMTVPFVFRPILIDGNIMYDGGIYNNFPANHVKEAFKPDVLIGSKATRGNTPPHEFDIMGQIENIIMKPSDYEIKPEEGILLDMDLDLDKNNLLAFDRLDEFVEIGYRKTMEKMDSIKMLVKRQAVDTVTLREQREAFKKRWPALRFNRIELEGLNKKQEQYVERSIRKRDSIIEVDDMKREYLKLANDKSLFYLYPRSVYNKKDSLFTLRLRVIPQAPLETRFGLFVSTLGLAQTYLGLSYREISSVSTHLKGSLQFGRFYNGLNLGFRIDYPTRIPIYLQGSFNYNGFDYNTDNSSFLFSDLKPAYIKEDEINFRVDLGIPYYINGVFKGGWGIGRNREVYYMTKDFSSGDTPEISNVNLFSAYLARERNTLNNKQYATSGSHSLHAVRVGYGIESYIPGSTSTDMVADQSNYFWITAKYENTGYIPIGGPFVLGYHFTIHATFKPLMSNYYSTIIEAPSFKPNVISQSLFMEHYRAHQFLAAGLMPVFNFGKGVHAKLEAYTFFPVQEILKNQQNEAYLGTYFKKMKTLFNASVNIVTAVGPLGFHAGYITEEEKPWVLQASFGYLLFNKRSTGE